MKRSGTGKAILAIFFLMGLFLVVIIAFRINGTDQNDAGWADLLFESDNKIGVVTIEGAIISSDEILKQLRKFNKKKTVKAILIRINSPGGTVAPAQEIYREIKKIKKPIVASMETVGASAAYYLASAADQVVCSQGTITGSIGVIMMLTDLHKIVEKIGVNVNVIKAGKFKDIGSAVRPLTDPEREILETFAKEIHEQFIRDVASGRKGKIDEEKLRSIADGRFFTGETAKEMGLVDTIGNFYDAVKIAAKLGGIHTEPELVYPEKKWKSYLDVLLESAIGTAVDKVMNRTLIMESAPVVR